MGSNKEWVVHKHFRGLKSAVLKKINLDVSKGGDPFWGCHDEEDTRIFIDDMFDSCIKEDIVYEYPEGWLDMTKHQYLENIYDELDLIIDKYDKDNGNGIRNIKRN